MKFIFCIVLLHAAVVVSDYLRMCQNCVKKDRFVILRDKSVQCISKDHQLSTNLIRLQSLTVKQCDLLTTVLRKLEIASTAPTPGTPDFEATHSTSSHTYKASTLPITPRVEDPGLEEETLLTQTEETAIVEKDTSTQSLPYVQTYTIVTSLDTNYTIPHPTTTVPVSAEHDFSAPVTPIILYSEKETTLRSHSNDTDLCYEKKIQRQLYRSFMFLNKMKRLNLTTRALDTYMYLNPYANTPNAKKLLAFNLAHL